MAYYQPSYSQPAYAGQPSPSGYLAPSPGYADQSAAPGYPVHYHQPYFSNGTPPPLPPRRVPPPQTGVGASILPTTGQFDGVQFSIDHRDSNSMLYIQLEPGAEVKAKSGSMVAMDATVKIKGKLKFSVAKLLSGENMSESTFTGPGQVLLAPATWGDIVPIHLDGHTQWSIGKDAYLACTIGVTHKNKSQGVGKALLSGEFLSAYNVNGAGILWVTSLGAIYSRTLQPGEQWIVDKGHLVAWTATCKDEDINAGGRFSRMNTDEDSVCRFTGPGIVYIQTRNPETLGGWINDRVSPPDVYHVVAKTLVPGS